MGRVHSQSPSGRDPKGIETSVRLSRHAGSVPSPFLGIMPIGWAGLVILAIVTWRATHWAADLPAEFRRTAAIGFVSAALLYAVGFAGCTLG
ncbi:MAG: hypothetical protein J7M25_04300 [Deltaproteobacteria bacterium]|nr:hypothetical protein [Deltaproteobacteria bacterium]